jgi:hypothetical protein
MNRKTVVTIVLVISLVFNVVLFVFGYIQKLAANSARELAIQNKIQAEEMSKLSIAEHERAEVMRFEAERAHRECEARFAALSSKK